MFSFLAGSFGFCHIDPHYALHNITMFTLSIDLHRRQNKAWSFRLCACSSARHLFLDSSTEWTRKSTFSVCSFLMCMEGNTQVICRHIEKKTLYKNMTFARFSPFCCISSPNILLSHIFNLLISLARDYIALVSSKMLNWDFGIVIQIHREQMLRNTSQINILWVHFLILKHHYLRVNDLSCL